MLLPNKQWRRPAYPLRTRLWIEWLAIAGLSGLLVILLVRHDATARLDNILYDRLGAFTQTEPDSAILIAAIDEASLARFGKWPWDRSRHAQFLNQLSEDPPDIVVFDILLSDQGKEPEDAALADAIASQPAVLLPAHFIAPGHNGAAFERIDPQPRFSRPALAVGHVNLTLDSDGILRRVALCASEGGKAPILPHIMEQAYRYRTGKSSSAAWQRAQNCTAPLLLPFAPRGAFSEISYSAIANGEVPSGFWKDRMVLAGATAIGLGDQYAVPSGDGGTLSGVEILGSIYTALERDDFIRPVGKAMTTALSLLALALLLAGFWRWTPRQALIASLGLIALLLMGSVTALWWRLWFPPGAALAGLALVYPLWGWRRLAAISDQMAADLSMLRQEPGLDPLIAARYALPADPVTEQSAALSATITQLRDLRRFVTDVIANLPDPMFLTDLEGHLLLANRKAKEILDDLPPGSAIELIVARLVDHEDRDDVHCFLTDTVGETEFVSFRNLNDRRPFLLHRARFLTGSGQQRGHIHYLADITALEEARQSREQMIEILSHDMRAPQSAILALLNSPTLLDSDVKRRIANHARRTMELAQNFVDMARMRDTPFDGSELILADLATEASDGLWPLASEHGIRLFVEDNGDDGFVIAESDILHRALINLIDNAIKFSPDGGTIRISIRKAVEEDRPSLCLQVFDDGPGIDAALLPHLFTRFVHSKHGKGRIHGTGLGLAFVAMVARRHGGLVRAQNRPEGGACFTLILPEAADEP